MVTFVNKLTVHGDLETFLAVKDRLTAYMSAQPGHVRNKTLRHVGDPRIFLEYAVWEDAASHRRAAGSEEFQHLVQQLVRFASAEPGLYESVEEAAGAR
ncbi:antibiotic biosynthesis monooxygenase family protein [Streptomyces sp. NPDC004542]|uniref:antibiotic biosynthesis monooxygenase family protein n=1 Tax=Streptomyces sp. NPDC004542 TaxID=3154281 RepID=UPI0033B9DDDC